MIARRIALNLGLAAIGAVGATRPGTAQRVSADIHIGSGPVAGTIRIGGRPEYRMYGRPRRAYAEEVYPVRVAVERRHGWNPRRHQNARLVVVFYDRDCDLYFDRYHRGLEEVRVYQDGGRYFRGDDDRDDREDRRGWNDRDRDRGHRDRYDRRDEKNRDWYYERNGRNDDDRWEHDHQH